MSRIKLFGVIDKFKNIQYNGDLTWNDPRVLDIEGKKVFRLRFDVDDTQIQLQMSEYSLYQLYLQVKYLLTKTRFKMEAEK